MKKLALALFLLILAAVVSEAAAPPRPEVDEPHAGFGDAVAMVVAGDWSGSGVAIRRGDHEFVWTNAHVVSSLETVKVVIDPESGLPRVTVSYKDAKLVRAVIVGGRKVGEETRWAEIIRFSDENEGYDLALLRSRAPLMKTGVAFGNQPLRVGQRVYHVGSPAGEAGYNSYIRGSISSIGRLKRGVSHCEDDRPFEMDQLSLPIMGGSSGGPVFESSTRLVAGLATQVFPRNPTIAFMVPSRSIRKFARESDCLWAVDHSVAMPAGEGYRRKTPRTTPLPVPPSLLVVPKVVPSFIP